MATDICICQFWIFNLAMTKGQSPNSMLKMFYICILEVFLLLPCSLPPFVFPAFAFPVSFAVFLIGRDDQCCASQDVQKWKNVTEECPEPLVYLRQCITMLHHPHPHPHQHHHHHQQYQHVLGLHLIVVFLPAGPFGFRNTFKDSKQTNKLTNKQQQKLINNQRNKQTNKQTNKHKEGKMSDMWNVDSETR